MSQQKIMWILFNFPLNDKIANYILAASDNNQRITMTNAGSTTITVNNNIFSANDTIYFINKDTGTTTITAGAGVTINNAAGLVLAQNQSGTLVAESASRFFLVNLGVVGYGTATGGSPSSILIGGQTYILI